MGRAQVTGRKKLRGTTRFAFVMGDRDLANLAFRIQKPPEPRRTVEGLPGHGMKATSSLLSPST